MLACALSLGFCCAIPSTIQRARVCRTCCIAFIQRMPQKVDIIDICLRADEKIYYEIEIRARQMMMEDRKAEIEKQRLLDLEVKERQDRGLDPPASSGDRDTVAGNEGGNESDNTLTMESRELEAEEGAEATSPLTDRPSSPEVNDSPIVSGQTSPQSSPSPVAAIRHHKGAKKKRGKPDVKDASPGNEL